jgi:hypothetical protein
MSSRYPNGVYHPKCGKRFPDNNTVGHCSSCCENFSGLGAFDQHHFKHNGKVLCTDPASSGDKLWWLDDKDVWHHGVRLTEEQKKEIWG